MKPSHLAGVLVLGTLGAGVSLLLGFSSGAGEFLSGSPLSFQNFLGNCTICHEFNVGPGKVELVGLPQRYRTGASYDLTVRVMDAEIQAARTNPPGAGFEVSAEGDGTHAGALVITDPLRTDYADRNVNYVTHTQEGFDDAVANWQANGGSYDFHLAWQAPSLNTGPVTVYASGQAVDNDHGVSGDHYYATYGTMQYAVPGDGDGDTDLDLRDYVVVQRCFGNLVPSATDDCGYVDFDSDDSLTLTDLGDFVTEMTGPLTSLPAEYVLADAVRGGLLYDTWWAVNGAPEPAGNHPLWALRPDPVSNMRTGSATFRCKECHGWDYGGVEGAYGSGSHRTGFGGVLGTALGPQQIFDLLKRDDPDLGGHNMDAFGMSDRDLWDVVKMTLAAAIDTSAYIKPDKTFNGNAGLGVSDYGLLCSFCHGDQGDAINFGTEIDPEYVGTIATGDPWEFLHKVRFGHPGSPMPSLDLFGWSLFRISDLSAYAATLPQ